MTTSVLETEYIDPERPYSQKELQYMRTKLYRSLHLGKSRAHHRRCDHFYLVKENGRKEKEMLEKNEVDIGNCSVCWKLNKTSRHLRVRARDMIAAYGTVFYEDPSYLDYDRIDLESAFYTWLYLEFN